MKNAKSVDILNIFLMFISLWMAFKIPFELFLFSYAVLGPLHYLTEIQWLHHKNYFSQNRYAMYVLILLSALVCLYPILQEVSAISWIYKKYPEMMSYSWIKEIGNTATQFLFVGMCTSLAATQSKKTSVLTVTFILSGLLSYFLKDLPTFIVLAGIFTPTLFHVYVFTGLFMLYGALKSKSLWGIVAVVVLILCLMIIMYAKINPRDYVISESTIQKYIQSTFTIVVQSVAKYFNLIPMQKNFSMLSEVSIRIQIFIAFAYTYHYLNWFSKTSVIEWHKKIDKQSLTIIIPLWLFSIGLYYYDYKVGFISLLLLSMMHVFLEFPLNITSIQGIIGHFFKRTN